MADPPEEKRTGFADLSAELRNDIYRLTLTSDEDIELCAPSEHQRLKQGRTICPNILRVCRFINAEATSILYAENAFAATATSLCDWIKQIDGNKDLLRSVAIVGYPKSINLRRALKSLSTTPHLNKLRFLYDPFTKKDDFRNGLGDSPFAKIVCPFVRVWYRQHKGTDYKLAANMLEFPGDNIWVIWSDPFKVDRFNRKAALFKQLMQDHLAYYDRAKIELEKAKIVLEDAIIWSAKAIARRRKADSLETGLNASYCDETELNSDNTRDVQPKVKIRGGQTFDAYGADNLLALQSTVTGICMLMGTDWSASEQRQDCLKIEEKVLPISIDYE